MIFATFFLLIAVQYALLAMNTRFVARGSYVATAVSDGIVAAFGFAIIQKVANADTFEAQAGYVLGGMAGGILGIWLTKHDSSGS